LTIDNRKNNAEIFNHNGYAFILFVFATLSFLALEIVDLLHRV